MLLSSNGKAIRFEEGHVRPMGRTARGVRGMRLAEGAEVISLIIPQSQTIDADADNELDGDTATSADGSEEQIYILTASEHGYGKRTRLEEFPIRGRGGQGVIAMQTTERNGALVAAMQVRDSDEMMLITDRGTLVRTRVGEVSITSRKPQTTRDRVLGVVTKEDAQYVFVDTPGFQTKEGSQLIRRMNRTVRSTLADVDAVIFVIEANGWRPADLEVLKLLPRDAKNVILALNKTVPNFARHSVWP